MNDLFFLLPVFEADLVTLTSQGLRVRTDSDVADIAYLKMSQMLSKASRG